MVWFRYSDYGKQQKRKTKSVKKSTPRKKSKSRIEPKIKIIPGQHKVVFKKASEI